MRKRVLYIGAFEMPDKNAAAHRVFSIAKLFRLCDYDVIFSGITKTSSYPSTFEGYLNKPVVYPCNTREWFNYFFNASDYIELIDSLGVDVVVLYNPHFGISTKLINYCKKHSILCLFDITEWQYNPFSIKPFKFLKWFDTNISMRIVNKKADGLILISSFLTDYYKKNKTILIPPLVDIEDKKWSLSPDNPTNNSVTFVYTGKSGNAKDRLDLIVDSFLELSNEFDYVFFIIGLTKKEFIEAYHYPLGRLLNSEKIVFLGNQNHETCLSYLKKSDCTFVVREDTRKNNAGFPTKFVEALTSGCHIIATGISDLKHYANDNVTFIDCLSKGCLKESIERFIKEHSIISSERTLSSRFDYRSFHEIFRKYLEGF